MHLFARSTLILTASLACADPGVRSTAPPPSAPAAGALVHDRYADESGSLDYTLFLPSGYDASRPVPLVVMLHGCTQDAEDFAAGTRMNELAEKETVLVAYPEQDPEANANRCWNWFERVHQRRGGGEPSLIAGITRKVLSEHAVDRRRVYVAGMSAGGAMAVILGAAYPDLFTAIGSHSGLEHGAAGNAAEAIVAMQTGGPDPDARGAAAFDAMGEHARVVPAIVFHGAEDPTVAVINGHQTLSQWARTDDLADDGEANGSIDDEAERTVHGQVPDGYAYSRSRYEDNRGAVVLEKWIIEEMTHRWSGGSPDGSYTDPAGPSASRAMLAFFLEHRRI